MSKTLASEVRSSLCDTYFLVDMSCLDLRSANLTPSSPPQTPTRLTRSPPPTSGSLGSNPSILEDLSEDSEAEPRQDNPPTPFSHFSSQTKLPASISFPRTAPSSLSSARRNSQPTRSAPVLRPTARPLSPTKSYSARSLSSAPTGNTTRPLSPTTTGTSTASAPTYSRSNTTGTYTPLRPSFTGNVGTKKMFGPSPGFEGTPSCPRCGKAVYFAEQVC